MSPKPHTFTYKTLPDGQNLEIDVYTPLSTKSDITKLPTLIWFHSGGGFVWSKEPLTDNWFPWWALHMATERNDWIFVAADYRLFAPTNANDLLEDVKDLFNFLAQPTLTIPGNDDNLQYRVDIDRTVVLGDSFGGYCARLAALYAEPKPKAMWSLYGLGGALLSPHYLCPREPGRNLTLPFHIPLLPDPYPELTSLLEYSPVTLSTREGDHTKQSPRLEFFTWVLQHGTYLDYLTGKKGLSERLRTAGRDKLSQSEHIILSADDVNLDDPAIRVRVEVLHIELEGEEHGFDALSGWKGEETHEMWAKSRAGEMEAFIQKAIRS